VTIPSVASPRFWRAFRAMPREVRKHAAAAYRLWQRDAFHPSLHFTKVGPDLWSVRIGMAYRALGRFEGDLLVWTWIGTHADYDQLLR